MNSSKLFCVVLALLLLATNSSIDPTDYFTKISAQDSELYLAIANAAPGFPAAHSDLVFHGAQRLFLPYLLGLLGRAFDIDNWILFKLVVKLCSLATLGLFWQLSKRLSSSVLLRCLAFASLCFHVYLLRLQLSFSGFLNDSLFTTALTLAILGLVEASVPMFAISAVLMGVTKQTSFLVLPVCILWTFTVREWQLKSLAYRCLGWFSLVLFLVFYYALVNRVIAPFSTPNSSAAMALGMLSWAHATALPVALVQLGEFAARGILGLLGPGSLVLILFLTSRDRFLTSKQKLLMLLFLAAIAQPWISGPAITGPSIQRLESIGIVPLLCLGLSRVGERTISWGTLIIAASGYFLASLHHLFSIIGPSLDHRYTFLALNICGLTIASLALWLGLRKPHSVPAEAAKSLALASV